MRKVFTPCNDRLQEILVMPARISQRDHNGRRTGVPGLPRMQRQFGFDHAHPPAGSDGQQPDRRRGGIFAALPKDDTDQTGLAKPAMHLDAETLQLGGDKIRCHRLFIGNFRMLVEILPPGGQLPLPVLDLGNQLRGDQSADRAFFARCRIRI